MLGPTQASSEKTRKAGDISLETAEKAAAVAAQQFDALRAQEKEAQAQVKTLRERLASMRASKFKANELLTRSASVSSCAVLLPVASLATHCSCWLTRLSMVTLNHCSWSFCWTASMKQPTGDAAVSV